VILLFVFISCIFSKEISKEEFSSFKDLSNDKVHPYCPTDDLWDWKLRSKNLTEAATCPMYSVCDDPAMRDKYKDVEVTVSLAIIVLCVDVGSGNCVSDQNKIQGQFLQLKADFESANIGFSLDETFFINSQYSTIAMYSNTNPKWYNDLMNLKMLYAHKPSQHINVFVTKQTAGNQGTLLGIGTFPWDDDFLTSYGGLWVNALYFGLGEKTLSHEFGHNLGLWHTFHGTNEINSCSDPCLESPHDKSDYATNFIGDRCQDTAATPMNYGCKDPAGTSTCSGKAWGQTDLDNIMGYTPDDCMKRISDNQAARAKCYLCRETPGILSDSSNCPKV